MSRHRQTYISELHRVLEQPAGGDEVGVSEDDPHHGDDPEAAQGFKMAAVGGDLGVQASQTVDVDAIKNHIVLFEKRLWSA